jgi:hypothetical protein
VHGLDGVVGTHRVGVAATRARRDVVVLQDDDESSAFDVGALPGCLDLAEGGALDGDDEFAIACPLHDLTLGVGDVLPVEAFGDSIDFEVGGANAPHLRLEGTGRHSRPSSACP